MDNIIVVGVIKKGSTNLWMASSLISLGFNIIPINYRDIINKYGSVFFENYVVDTVKKNNPALVIFCKCNSVNPELIKECTKLTKTWLWFMDSYIVLKSFPEILQHAKNATFSSATCGTSVRMMKEAGANAYRILEGSDILHRKVEPVEEYVADISLIGSKTPLRDEYLTVLKDNGCSVKFYGRDYSGTYVDEEEWSKICSSSKFMLSVGTYNNIPEYFPSRVFEYMACGSCVLHLDEIGSVTEFFENNVDLVCFRDKDELIHIINTLDENTIKQIGDSGRIKVLNNFTWTHSMIRLLRIVEEYVTKGNIR